MAYMYVFILTESLERVVGATFELAQGIRLLLLLQTLFAGREAAQQFRESHGLGAMTGYSLPLPVSTSDPGVVRFRPVLLAWYS